MITIDDLAAAAKRLADNQILITEALAAHAALLHTLTETVQELRADVSMLESDKIDPYRELLNKVRSQHARPYTMADKARIRRAVAGME